MPTPKATSIIQKALLDCKDRSAPEAHRVLEGALVQLRAQSFEDFHEVCGQGDYNLGTMACRYGDGWTGRNFNTFRQLIRKGYNPNAPDEVGRTPSLQALHNERVWMNVEDFRWAFSHRLNPLAFHADPTSQSGMKGKSLLSVNFVEGRSGEISAYLTKELTDRLARLDVHERNNTLDMLRATALSCYGDMLSQVESTFLDQITPVAPILSAPAPRF